ncbi:hypothetical protein UCRPC4_g02254 [Phaeomoniella chlamydospora]|uniref:DUF221-domain-containing protein n=1 Tax=Phaeomoniella chlamydospora TaxID=158046 RepID=A0A0G2GNG7_PHACM|nr:hypothetical protein UCRPC4_g02254 [Phaeomoniella chlamydospora]
MDLFREYRDEAKLRKIFGDCVRKVWLPKWSKELENFVEERRQTALRLEKAEIELIKTANAARTKAIEAGDFAIKERPHPDEKKASEESSERTINAEPDPDSPSADRQDSKANYPSEKTDFESQAGLPLPDVNGSVASQWIPHTARPHHRPIANKGRRVDTIKWTRMRLKRLKTIINKLRRQQQTTRDHIIPVAFIEFTSQAEAQSAYQTLTHHRAMHMSPRFIGVRPFEIVWKNLSMRWWEQIIRQFAIDAAVAVLILFWAIPCAGVGIISNIDYLAEKVPFLSWLDDLPSSVIGFIKGLLPALALSWIMNVVPWILRNMASAAGVPTLTLIELYTSAAAASIITDPTKAESLLAKNLPTASNFYISYILVQSLGFGALSYACIAPIVLGFATAGIYFVYVVYRYNILFVYDSEISTMGLSYPRALMHLLVGLYFGEVCLAGLMALKSSFGPLVVSLGLLVFTMLVHVSLYSAVGPLLNSLPKTLAIEAQEERGEGDAQGKTSTPPQIPDPTTIAPDNFDFGQTNDFNFGETAPPAQPQETTSVPFDNFDFGQTNDFNFGLNDPPHNHNNPDEDEDEDEDGVHHEPGAIRALPEGTPNTISAGTDFIQSYAMKQVSNYVDINSVSRHFSFLNKLIFPSRITNPNPNFFIKWLHPEVYQDYSVLRSMIPHDEYPDPSYPAEIHRHIYHPPYMFEEPPLIWIPRDVGGISKQEVEHTKKINPITDEGVDLNENGGLKVDLDSKKLDIDVVKRLRW